MKNTTKSYPSIAQSFGIAGIMILAQLGGVPIKMLDKFIGTEATTLIMYLTGVGVTFLIAYTIRKRKAGNKPFNMTIKNGRVLPVVMIATVPLLFGIIEPISSLIPMPDFVKEELLDFINQKGVYTFIMMVIAAPVLEELIFRGIILDGLLKKYTPAKSILVSSFLFGIVHMNPWQFITGMIMGILIGWVFYHTRSVLIAMIIHATANFSGYLVRVFVDVKSMLNMSLLEAYGGLTNLVLAIVISIVVILICIAFLKREFKKAETAIADPRPRITN